MAVDVSIIIVSWNTCGFLKSCLASIYETTYNLALEVFVVDNGSSDGSPQLLRDLFPEVNVIANQENVGFARANNQALKQAKGAFCLFLNSDALVTPSAIDHLAKALDQDPLIGIVGPQLLNPDGSVQPSIGDFPTAKMELMFQSFLFKLIPPVFPLGKRIHPLQKRQYNRKHQVDWVSGAAVMVKRNLIEAIGGIDETLFMYGEDVELCWKIAGLGYQTLYVSEAKVIHHGGGSRRNHVRWIEDYTRGHIAFYARHCSKSTQHIAYSAIFLGSLLRMVAWFVVAAISHSMRKEASDRIRGYYQASSIAWSTLTATRR